MTVNFANGDEQKYSSNIVNINHFTDATRNIATSSTTAAILIEFDFTKSFADTSIVLWGYTPHAIQNSYHSGCYAEIGIPASSDYTRYYEAAHFAAVVSAGSGDDGWYSSCYWNGCWNSTDTGLNSSGSKRVRLGYDSRDNSNQRPGNWWNPDKRSDRGRERTTQITVMEVYGNINKFT